MTTLENMPQSNVETKGADLFNIGVSKGLKTKDGVPIAEGNLTISLNEEKGVAVNAGVSAAGGALSESVSVFPSNESGETEVIHNFESNSEGDTPIGIGTINLPAFGRNVKGVVEFIKNYAKTKADRTMNPQNYINNEER